MPWLGARVIQKWNINTETILSINGVERTTVIMKIQTVKMNQIDGLCSSMKSGFFKIAVISSCLVLGTSIAFAWGEHTFIRSIQTQTMLIRHKATEEQRRAAESNAKAFFSQLLPEKKLELKKKNIYAVLIRTTRSRETSPAAKDVRMRYNLDGESLVDGYAYEFDRPLQAETITR